MCGITGILNIDGKQVSEDLLKKMTDTLYHRGPDDEGFYIDKGIGFGHRRLSIIDLTDAGHQPMCNEDGSIWMIFNGEIYNYKDLRSELKTKGHIFKSNTDSEVVIHSYEEWGVECLNKFNGMWAFAIWDSKQKEIFLARDRFGIKPLHYYQDEDKFLFASEIKAILTHKDLLRKPNDSIIFDYLAYPYNDYIDHTEETFFKGIKRLMPAHYLVLSIKGDIKISRYWDLNPEQRFNGISDEDVAQKFYDLFEDSIRLRLQSDVPLGTCLSGGLDSSSIVCMVNNLISRNGVKLDIIGERQKTFSARFNDKSCDEGEYIHAVTEKVNVESHAVFPDGKTLFELAPQFVRDQGEPVGSTSQWAAWLVMKLTRERGVTVVLSGQGADEILAGYGIYFLENFKDLLKKFRLYQLRNEIDKYSENNGYSGRDVFIKLLRDTIPFHPFQWKRRILGQESEAFPLWLNTDFIQNNKHKIAFKNIYNSHLNNSLYHFLTVERLPSLLRFEDRNSMAFSIESRLPFLDYRLVEFCFSLPTSQKIKNGIGKIVLRNAMKEILPQTVHERIRKIGLATPEMRWFRYDCREQIEQIIHSKSFNERVYFNGDKVKEHFHTFACGKPVNIRPIWKYINLELWLQQFFG